MYSIDCSVFIAGLPQWAMLRQRGQGGHAAWAHAWVGAEGGGVDGGGVLTHRLVPTSEADMWWNAYE